MSIHAVGEEAGAVEDPAQEQYEYAVNLLLLDLEKLFVGNVPQILREMATNHKSPEVARHLVSEMKQTVLVSDGVIENNVHNLLAHQDPETLLAVMQLLKKVGLLHTPLAQGTFLNVLAYPALKHLHQILLILDEANLLSGEMGHANIDVLMTLIFVTSPKDIALLLKALKQNTTLLNGDMRQHNYSLLMEHALIALLPLPLYQLRTSGLLSQDNFNVLLSFDNEDELWMVKTTINKLYGLGFWGQSYVPQGSDTADSVLAVAKPTLRRTKQGEPYAQSCLEFIFTHPNPVILEALMNGVTLLKKFGFLDGEMTGDTVPAFFSPAIENLAEGLQQLERCNLLSGAHGQHNVTQLIQYAPILFSAKLWLQVPHYAFTQTAFERLTRFCQEHEMDKDGGEAAFADYVYKHCRPTMGSYSISQNPYGFYGATVVVNPVTPAASTNLQPQ